MAFDLGFDFRQTSGYVTDPSYGVPVLGEAYPHTYTAANGYNVNAGWSAATTYNVSNTNDPRIAGINYGFSDGTLYTFTVDLSSGSAPGAGAYTVDCAIGGKGRTESFKVLDNATVLIDGTNGGAGHAQSAGQFTDASLATISASTTWTGTTASKTFASTTAKLVIGYVATFGFQEAAHFRLTLQGASQSVVPVLMAQYRQRRN